MSARIGNIRARIDNSVEKTASRVENTGFAKPMVVVVEAARAVAVVPAMRPAVPPPPMIAKAQETQGSKSPSVTKNRIVPATVARGTAMVSSALSNQGM